MDSSKQVAESLPVNDIGQGQKQEAFTPLNEAALSASAAAGASISNAAGMMMASAAPSTLPPASLTGQGANNSVASSSVPGSAMGAQAAAAFLQQYFAQQTQNLQPAEAGTMQHTLWQLQQAMQPAEQQAMQQLLVQQQQLIQQQPQAASNVPLKPAPVPVMQQLQPQQRQLKMPPSTVSLSSSSIPNAVIYNNSNSRKHKAADDSNNNNNVLQFSDAASKSLQLDHSHSIVSSSSVTSLGDLPPPKEKTDSELELMTPAERRRYERNLREQQRAYRISQQIKTLREVLSESRVPFKPNKFSILVSVTEYIKNLQQRSVMLDVEQKKLTETIRRTGELVASRQLPSSEDERSSIEAFDHPDRDALFVQGLDYKTVFQFCPFASGVASLDGRILDCNPGLEQCFGTECQEMEQQSLFLYIRNHQDVFEAMADILRRSSIACETGGQPVGPPLESQELLFWCGPITTHKNLELQLNITLTCTGDGNPKYFSFTVAPTA